MVDYREKPVATDKEKNEDLDRPTHVAPGTGRRELYCSSGRSEG